MPLPQDLDLPSEGYLLPSAQGLALPECSWLLLGHNRDSLQDMDNVAFQHASNQVLSWLGTHSA